MSYATGNGGALPHCQCTLEKVRKKTNDYGSDMDEIYNYVDCLLTVITLSIKKYKMKIHIYVSIYPDKTLLE